MTRKVGVERGDVKRGFNEFVQGKPAVILSVVPNGKPELAAAPQNFEAPERTLPESYGDEGSELPLRPVADTFDRSQKPVPGMNPVVELPAIWDTSLANGVRVLAVPNEETPTMTVRASFDMGRRDEPEGNWIAYGDDAAIAAGLSAIMQGVHGQWLVCGDAIADPLTGLHAALAGWASWLCGGGHLLELSLEQTVRHCITSTAPPGGDFSARQASWQQYLWEQGIDALPPRCNREAASSVH